MIMSLVRWPIGRKNQTPFAMGSFKCYVTPGGGGVRPSVTMRYKGGGGGRYKGGGGGGGGVGGGGGGGGC